MLRTTDDARFWNRIARKYAADAIADVAGYERTIECSRSLLSGSDSIVELGCGTGTTALRLAPFVHRIVATDLASEMIAIAREKATAAGCVNAEFVTSALEGLATPDPAFDAVLAFNVLHLIRDRASALRHIARLLRPGGLFISKTPCLSEMNPLIRLAVPLAQLVGKAPTVSFFGATALAGEIESAGFTILDRARHGSGRKDSRIFIVARSPVRQQQAS
jgi:ubiquinone/menaquinone biosynthesis C-methylase UbiE